MEGLFSGDEGKKNHSRAKRSPKQHENDAIFDGLARFFFPSGVGPSDGPRIGKVVANLRAKNATFEELTYRIANWDRTFPNCPGGLTLESLNKHWDKLGATKLSPPTPCPPKPTLQPGIPIENQAPHTRRQYAAWKEWMEKYGKAS